VDIKLGSHTHKSNNNTNLEFKGRVLVLESHVYSQIQNLIAESIKMERVGLGFGSYNESVIKMNKFIPMENLDKSETSFSLDYEKMLKEIQIHEQNGLILLGFFHTHPKNATSYPSKKDCYYMRYWPYPYIWMIASAAKTPLLRIFSLYRDKIIEIQYSFNKS